MSYIDAQQFKSAVHVWERGEDGELIHTTYSSPYNLYMRDNTESKSKFKDIYGNPLKKLEFDSRRSLEKFADSHGDVVCESDLSPSYKVLLDHYRDSKTDAPYNVCLFDIEVDFDLSEGRGYPSPEDPFGEINAISVYDSKFNAYLMFIPEHLKGKVELEDTRHNLPIEHVWCISEMDMFRMFVEYLYHVDIWCSFNGDQFDTRYMMERAIILFGEDKALTLFTRNNIKARRREFIDDYGQDTWEWKFPGRPHLDLMRLYKKFHPGEKKSFSLDSICLEELGEQKIPYDGDLGKLYRDDPQTFFEYSLHDSRLLMMLEDKQKLIDLTMFMCRDGCFLPTDIYQSVKPIEMAIMKMCRSDGVILPDHKNNEKEEFPGALVFDSMIGKSNWVCSSDVVSEYPSVMMMLGLSLETMVFQLTGGYEDYVKVITSDDSEGDIKVELMDGSIETAPPSAINEIIRDSGYTISGNGTIFNGSEGILARFVRQCFERRQHYKKMMKEATDDYERAMYNVYQLATKTQANSTYGCCSNVAFRMYDIRLAGSITLTAQLFTKFLAYRGNKYIEEQLEAA